jgi:hypothetical protein
MEEEEEAKTPLQLTFEEGKHSKNTYEECCGSSSRVSVASKPQEERGSPSYVRDHRPTHK